jgi:uncharacterized protein (TIGR03083 family)
MGLDNGPATPEWIRQGAAQLLTTLREVDPGTPMWAWGADQHARFWSRRQLHETLVHRMDLELATGTAPAASPDIATDAIDEFLANLAPAATFSPDVRKLRGHGQRLVFRTTDGETQRWTVTLLPGGFEVGTGAGPGDVELAAPSTTLLLVVYRRLALGSPGVTLTGASELADFWVENSALT